MPSLVSIVIPVYNAIPYLDECLASVLAQTYPHIEVIMINDGSTDDSEKQLSEFAVSDERFKLYSQENHGLGYTRNRGLSLSKGKYIFFLDADDTIPKKAIKLLVAAAEENDADYAVGKVVRFNENRRYIPIRHVEFSLYNQNKLTSLSESPELMQDSIACNKLWKKSLLTANNLSFKEGKYYEDLTLTLKAAVLAKKIRVIDKVVYNWRIREHENNPSITQQQMKLANTLDRLEALEKNKKWLLDSNMADRLIEEHDLKSVLDIIRLHVIKYTLIEEVEREEWQSQVVSFLNKIPADVAQKLPNKEKIFYTLLMENKMEDLLLFSKVLTNTETYPLIEQQENRFLLKGLYKEYDITPSIKPAITVERIEMADGLWRLAGSLIVPKATVLAEGKVFAKAREGSSEIPFTPVLSVSKKIPSHYACEAQDFELVIDPLAFMDSKQDIVFDFYFRLDAYPDSPTSRVRLGFSPAQEKGAARVRGNILFFYRTDYGNLSMKIQKNTLKKFIANKIRPFVKK